MPTGPVIFLILAVFALGGNCQSWPSGDNSTIEGCSSHCSQLDNNLDCWHKTRGFFEKSLMAQLRHYTAVQVNIDQWHRRHGMPDGQNISKVREEMREDLGMAWKGEHDLVSPQMIESIADLVAERLQQVSNRTIGRLPHLECPTPCEYRNKLWMALFIVSLIANMAFCFAVIPFMMRMRQHGDYGRILLPSGDTSHEQ